MTYRMVLEAGGQAPRFKGREAKRKVQRELHGLAIQVQGDRPVKEIAALAPQGVNVAQWWFDCRRGRQSVYGSLFRFIDLAIRLRTPKSVLMVIPEVIASYINDQVTDDALAVPALTVENGRAA